jgi:hypothetical protein
MEAAEYDYHGNQGQPNDQMKQEHRLVEVILEHLARVPLCDADTDEIHRIERNESEQRQDDKEEPSLPGADGGNVPPAGPLGLTVSGRPGAVLAICGHDLSIYRMYAFKVRLGAEQVKLNPHRALPEAAA